ncbi:sporulation inhibitor of replication protein SirA [Oceanobacillus profundus]|uniref:Sporulation inhibitor of replication protein SirA n=1 Tax=Oceanobacillus profundus TaxID=372463 RepID=A0A417YA62_9BACI|nr:sporulation inhibitor of replication protein SirA [Oceanobacillus profundus]MDO6451143.1 sporulation inhibitor of replication protein SirA [Oceanobacillus profundus]RHW29451.1 sporulation inhibitor of replication protein SirA [Oceanobacillus profundus]
MMEYAIYWIKEDVARSYFHKSDILHRFLKEYEANPTRKDLRDQYIYITHHISLQAIAAQLNSQALNQMSIQTDGHMLYLTKNDIMIRLHAENGRLHFQCNELQDAAMLLFPMLRNCYPFVFVQGKKAPNYGWVSPITQKNSVRMRQILYSHR